MNPVPTPHLRASKYQIHQLQPGTLYSFQFKQQSGNNRWYVWGMVASFVARQTDEYVDKIILSGRPEFGTTEIPVPSIVGIYHGGVAPRRPKRFPNSATTAP
jgi:hypothetical protein